MGEPFSRGTENFDELEPIEPIEIPVDDVHTSDEDFEIVNFVKNTDGKNHELKISDGKNIEVKSNELRVPGNARHSGDGCGSDNSPIIGNDGKFYLGDAKNPAGSRHGSEEEMDA